VVLGSSPGRESRINIELARERSVAVRFCSRTTGADQKVAKTAEGRHRRNERKVKRERSADRSIIN